MTSKSKTYAFRLHPEDQKEKDAMDIVERLLDEGWTMRQIMTDAILHTDGRTPQMYKLTEEKLTKGYFETSLSDFATHIIHELRANGIVAGQQLTGKSSPFDKDEDAELAQNLANGFLARRRKGGK